MGVLAVPAQFRGRSFDVQVVSPDWDDGKWEADVTIERSEDGGETWTASGAARLIAGWRTVTSAGGGALPSIGVGVTDTTTHVRLHLKADAAKRCGLALTLSDRNA